MVNSSLSIHERCFSYESVHISPILGSTFNGQFEDVKGKWMIECVFAVALLIFSGIHDVVSELNQKNGWQVGIMGLAKQ